MKSLGSDTMAPAFPEVLDALVIVPTTNAKMSIDAIRSLIERARHPHISRPAVVSITQATEEGTVYTVDEIRAIAEIAHENNAYLHVDGARLANAIASLGSSVEAMLTKTGVDVVSFGGTKAGAMYGDAAVFLNSKLIGDIHRVHIASGQLSAKSRYVAAQVDALLDDDLWLRGAENANEQARKLGAQLAEIPGITVRPGDVNMVFVDATPEVATKITSAFGTAPYDFGTTTFRWVTAWNTTETDVEELVKALHSCVM